MNYTFDKMERNKKLYKKMWDKTEFCSDNFITNKNWTGEESGSSFYIDTPIAFELFSKIILVLAVELAGKFEIKNNKLFREKFNEACSGSGQEALKITTMHSSSLCALLFFYNVCKENKLELQLGNGEPKQTYIFDKSFFEFQNIVTKKGSPSNMDVVLLGYEKIDEEADTSKPVVLFLESKFSEYYSTLENSLDIALAYLDNKYGKMIYDDKISDIGYEIRLKDDDSTVPKSKFRLIAPNKTYIGGIKQMISHYIGVRNLLDGEKVEERACEAHKEVVDKIIKDKAEVLMGSIIFDDLFEKVEDKKKYYGAYEEAHRKLVGRLNEVSKGVDNVSGTGRLTVLEEPLTYTKLVEEMKKQNFQLDKKVEEYYFEKAKATTSDTSEC